MVLNLSNFFRLSLSKGQESFTVEETFKHLQYYIRIQQIRFAERFTVEYCASEDSQHLHILKLLLQPLVENAILHGLEKRKKGGALSIRTDVSNDRLIIQVTDNGRGIPGPRLMRIQQALARIRFGDYTAPLKRTPSFCAAQCPGSNHHLLWGDGGIEDRQRGRERNDGDHRFAGRALPGGERGTGT